MSGLKRRIVESEDSDSSAPSPTPATPAPPARAPGKRGGGGRRAALARARQELKRRKSGGSRWGDEPIDLAGSSGSSSEGDGAAPVFKAARGKKGGKKGKVRRGREESEGESLDSFIVADAPASDSSDAGLLDDQADDNSGAGTSSDDASAGEGEAPRSKRRDGDLPRRSSEKKRGGAAWVHGGDADAGSSDDAFIDDSSSSGSGSDGSGPGFSHARVTRALEEGDESEDDVVAFFRSTTKSRSLRESHALWLLDLVDQCAHHLREPGAAMRRGANQRKLIANVQGEIESPLNTYRESLLGSGAWQQSVSTAIRSRPVYSKFAAGSDARDCDICRRQGHHAPYHVMLSGPRYNSALVDRLDVVWGRVLKWEGGEGEGDGEDTKAVR
ncbi:hypothetical protein TeGR_g13913, partial [Tetraparma gracilis]